MRNLCTGSLVPRAKYHRAQEEHAFMLRCEGLTYDEIGERLGVSGERARACRIRFAQKMRWAMRRTRYLVAEPGFLPSDFECFS